MIIDGRNYGGVCSCGKVHEYETEFCIIEKGCLARADEYISKYGFSGFGVAVYDENTYKATEGLHPQADKEIILSPENLHANEHGVDLAMKEIPAGCDYLIAVGSGTVHDITRYCAYLLKIPFVSCPTAASVDGFCSSVAAMTWEGCKKTLTAVAPRIVIADLDIISKAPMRLTRSGFGDMIGKYIALTDWKIGVILKGEHFCKVIYDMTLEATKAVVESADGIANGDISAYEKLTYGLLLSGIAMKLLGNSRCASGAEHHISHFIEMMHSGFGESSEALHGEKVGVGTLIARREYERLTSTKNISFTDYPILRKEYIKEMFGTLTDSIIAENAKDSAEGITAELLYEKWDEICTVISSVPSYGELLECYRIIGACTTLSDIGIGEDKLSVLLEYSPLVRNRVTLMRLRRAIIE